MPDGSQTSQAFIFLAVVGSFAHLYVAPDEHLQLLPGLLSGRAPVTRPAGVGHFASGGFGAGNGNHVVLGDLARLDRMAAFFVPQLLPAEGAGVVFRQPLAQAHVTGEMPAEEDRKRRALQGAGHRGGQKA